MPDRASQLDLLDRELTRLVAVLQRDEDCPWTKHFEHCVKYVAHLRSNGFTQDELNDLSSTVTRVYGGSGSFNDYPVIPSHGVSGTELSELGTAVYEAAFELRVIGRY